MRSRVHAAAFFSFGLIEGWVEGRRVRRKRPVKRYKSYRAWIVNCSSRLGPPSVVAPFLVRTHGMVSPSTIVLVPFTFCTAPGSFGEFLPFYTTPGP
jgi:hypothetical protein